MADMLQLVTIVGEKKSIRTGCKQATVHQFRLNKKMAKKRCDLLEHLWIS